MNDLKKKREKKRDPRTASKIFRDYLERSKVDEFEVMYAQDIELKCTFEI